ncbi:MAG: hypothetical protein ABSF34_01495 [Verrucomicrobiota bacterium]
MIGGLIALGLLGGSGFYIYQGWSRNAQASDKLNEIYNTLQTLGQANPGPGNDQINNTEIARSQTEQIRDWVLSSGNYFLPIDAIPPDSVTSETFAAALRRTVAQLQSEATNASVALPPEYDFSFAAQRPLMQFASGSLVPLSVQLGEVKKIAEIIFSAKVNSLDGIQRVRVSDDDASGPQTDYTDKQPVTNNLAIITPYVVTFHSFTPELSRVISAFATSSNAFIIESINVEPAGAETGADMSQPGMPPPGENPEGYPPRGYPGRFGYGGYGYRGGYPPGGTQSAAQPVMNKGGLQTVLKEQLLQITLEVELVKLLPKS